MYSEESPQLMRGPLGGQEESKSVNGIAGVALLTWRTGWPVILLGIAPMLVALLLRGSRQVPPFRAFVGVLWAPVFMVIWAGLNWAAEEGLSHDTLHWRTIVLLALTIAALECSESRFIDSDVPPAAGCSSPLRSVGL